MLLVWVAVIWLIILAVRGDRRDPAPDPRRILAERYARGEISAEEYEERRGVLEGSRR